MNQSERRQFLLRELLAEEPESRSLAVPDEIAQKSFCIPEDADAVIRALL